MQVIGQDPRCEFTFVRRSGPDGPDFLGPRNGMAQAVTAHCVNPRKMAMNDAQQMPRMDMAEKAASETCEGAAHCHQSQRKEEKDAEKGSKCHDFTLAFAAVVSSKALPVNWNLQMLLHHHMICHRDLQRVQMASFAAGCHGHKPKNAQGIAASLDVFNAVIAQFAPCSQT